MQIYELERRSRHETAEVREPKWARKPPNRTCGASRCRRCEDARREAAVKLKMLAAKPPKGWKMLAAKPPKG